MKTRTHRFKINELERSDAQKKAYWYNTRRFIHVYTKDDEKDVWNGHLEILLKKKMTSPFSIGFHIAGPGHDSSWRGHLTLLWFSVYWGHSGFKKLADWLVRCSGYKWDTRDWSFRVADGTVWWSFAEHDDYCKLHNRHKRVGSFNISIPRAIWGPIRYSWDDVDKFETVLQMEEGSYPANLTLERTYVGRTKVAKSKHIKDWSIDVDVPQGIPTHYDKSGGWKGDRTYGWNVVFDYNESAGWQQDAVNAVLASVHKMRARGHFREAQPKEG